MVHRNFLIVAAYLAAGNAFVTTTGTLAVSAVAYVATAVPVNANVGVVVIVASGLTVGADYQFKLQESPDAGATWADVKGLGQNQILSAIQTSSSAVGTLTFDFPLELIQKPDWRVVVVKGGTGTITAATLLATGVRDSTRLPFTRPASSGLTTAYNGQ